jgi:hypothetical protein
VTIQPLIIAQVGMAVKKKRQVRVGTKSRRKEDQDRKTA